MTFPARQTELKVERRDEPEGVVVFGLDGELDISSLPSLEAVVDPVLERPPSRLAFDLSRLRFMDSSGIALLLRCAQAIGTVEVRRPSPIISRVLTSMGLTEVLEVTE